jgi:hypothetical protein
VPLWVHVGETTEVPDVATFLSARPIDTEPEPGVELFESRKVKPIDVANDGDVAPFVAMIDTTTAFDALVTTLVGGVKVVEAVAVPDTTLDVATTGVAEFPFVRP